VHVGRVRQWIDRLAGWGERSRPGVPSRVVRAASRPCGDMAARLRVCADVFAWRSTVLGGAVGLRALSCSHSLLITLSCWVLALLTRFTDDDHGAVVVGDYQRIVVAFRMAAGTAMPLVANRLPPNWLLSWPGHDATCLITRTRSVNRRATHSSDRLRTPSERLRSLIFNHRHTVLA
jgi:hypothetical protein